MRGAPGVSSRARAPSKLDWVLVDASKPAVMRRTFPLQWRSDDGDVHPELVAVPEFHAKAPVPLPATGSRARLTADKKEDTKHDAGIKIGNGADGLSAVCSAVAGWGVSSAEINKLVEEINTLIRRSQYSFCGPFTRSDCGTVCCATALCVVPSIVSCGVMCAGDMRTIDQLAEWTNQKNKLFAADAGAMPVSVPAASGPSASLNTTELTTINVAPAAAAAAAAAEAESASQRRPYRIVWSPRPRYERARPYEKRFTEENTECCTCQPPRSVVDWELLLLFPPPEASPYSLSVVAASARELELNSTATITGGGGGGGGGGSGNTATDEASRAVVITTDPWFDIPRPQSVREFSGESGPSIGSGSGADSLPEFYGTGEPVVPDVPNVVVKPNPILARYSILFQFGEFVLPFGSDAKLRRASINVENVQATLRELELLTKNGYGWTNRCCFRCCCDFYPTIESVTAAADAAAAASGKQKRTEAGATGGCRLTTAEWVKTGFDNRCCNCPGDKRGDCDTALFDYRIIPYLRLANMDLQRGKQPYRWLLSKRPVARDEPNVWSLHLLFLKDVKDLPALDEKSRPDSKADTVKPAEPDMKREDAVAAIVERTQQQQGRVPPPAGVESYLAAVVLTPAQIAARKGVKLALVQSSADSIVQLQAPTTPLPAEWTTDPAFGPPALSGAGFYVPLSDITEMIANLNRSLEFAMPLGCSYMECYCGNILACILGVLPGMVYCCVRRQSTEIVMEKLAAEMHAINSLNLSKRAATYRLALSRVAFGPNPGENPAGCFDRSCMSEPHELWEAWLVSSE